MTTQRVTSRCVEICIDVCDNHYLAELQVDGMIREKLEFQGQLQLTNWADSSLFAADGDLYVHLRPRRACHNYKALELAQKLSRQGMTIGISGRRPVCLPQNRRLQCPCGDNIELATAEF